jgi:uncharacterized protein with NRDE domain
MCLIVCAYHYHSRYPLVIAANRDEFHSRPTRSAGFWTVDRNHPGLLAGQDLERGGTWLGLTRDGRFAAVTNIRHPQPKAALRSRGELTRQFLLSDRTAGQYMQEVQGNLDEFAGFNLLVGDREKLFFLNSNEGQVVALQPGVYGLSNGTLDSDWPKIQRSKAVLREMLDGDRQPDTDRLIAMMRDMEPAAETDLPDTGVSRDLELLLSPIFIRNPQRDYGTRCSTAIILDEQGTVRFSEQSYGADTTVNCRQFFQFSLLAEPAATAPSQ